MINCEISKLAEKATCSLLYAQSVTWAPGTKCEGGWVGPLRPERQHSAGGLEWHCPMGLGI